MQTKFIIAAVVIIFLILFGLGAALSEKCVEISGCRSCWKTTPVVVQSELCSNKTCLAQPADQQNNAIVDSVLCACGKAKSSSYADESANRKIQDVVSEFSHYNITANELCEQPGLFLAKRSYD